MNVSLNSRAGSGLPQLDDSCQIPDNPSEKAVRFEAWKFEPENQATVSSVDRLGFQVKSGAWITDVAAGKPHMRFGGRLWRSNEIQFR